MDQCPQNNTSPIWSIVATIPQIWKVNDGKRVFVFMKNVVNILLLLTLLSPDITVDKVSVALYGYTANNNSLSADQPLKFSSDLGWAGEVYGSFSFLGVDTAASVAFNTTNGLQDIYA